jgi:hypothetical protein
MEDNRNRRNGAMHTGWLGAFSASAIVFGMALSVGWADPLPAASETVAGDVADQSPDLTVRAIKVTGTVMIRGGDEQPWRKIENDQTLAVGDEIRTGVRGGLVMEMGPNAIVNVDRLSEVVIGRLEHDRQTNTIRTLLGVKHGKVEFDVKRVGFDNDFRIASPSDVIAVRGTRGTFKAYEGPAEVSGNRSNGFGAIVSQSRSTDESVALSQNESVEGGDRSPSQTQQKQQNVGDKLAGGGSFSLNQQVNQGGQNSLRGEESLMSTRNQFQRLPTDDDIRMLTRFCDPESEYYDADRCRRIVKLLGPKYRDLYWSQQPQLE